MKTYQLLFLLHEKKIQNFKKSHKGSIPFINRAYANVANKIKESHSLQSKISPRDVKKLGITQKMKDKLTDLLLQKIDEKKCKKMQNSYLYEQLIQIAGIGNAKARSLVESGLTDVKQLQLKKWQKELSDGTKFWLKYRPLQKIPHAHIKKIEKKLIKFRGADVKIVGGFLRKKPFSKDIDIMIASDNCVIDDYLLYLNKTFKTIVYSHGADKASVLIKTTAKQHTQYYKLDIFRTPVKYKYGMLLYATGSKKFNIKMRLIAKKKGYLLNQKGLFFNGIFVDVQSEKDIFKRLDMKYVKPANR